MPKRKEFAPNLRTPSEKFDKTESVKGASLYVNREMRIQLKETDYDYVSSDVESYLKSYGVYLEFNRDEGGRAREREWMYMIRFANPGGGPISREQYNAYDDLASQYTIDPEGHSSLRFTTRQNIQFHWIKKKDLKIAIKTMAELDVRSLNGCGDNTRNVMGCPLSRFSDVFNAAGWAHKLGAYFQLPLESYIKVFEIDPAKVRKPGQSFDYGPRLLNRKFKIGVSTLHRDETTGKLVPDNCIEVLTHDLAVVPLAEGDKVTKFQVYIGGGQGERNGHPSMATLAKPFCIVGEDKLLQVLDAIVQVHKEWGDRENRYWARLKYVVKVKGVDWYRDEVTARLGFALEKPNPKVDYGRRHLHFGWSKQPSNGLWTYGAFLENGRVTDHSPNGQLKSMISHVMNKYPIELSISPNQDALFSNIPAAAKEEFEADLKKYGYGLRNGKPFSQLRLHSGACVGLNTCRLAYTDSEKFEPELIDELEKMGWGDMKESIGITGCERQCFRPATKTIGLVGTGMNRYGFKFFGEEDARHQGRYLISDDQDKLYLRMVPREVCAPLISEIFKNYKANAKPKETLGEFHRRLGDSGLIKFFSENPISADLCKKPFPADCVID